MTRHDERTLIKWTVAMEAEGEPLEGKVGVAFVIINRSRLWKRSIADVCLKGYQFSCWNTESPTRLRLDIINDKIMAEAEHAAYGAYFSGTPYSTIVDPTNGATHYLNKEETKRLTGGRLPKWIDAMKEMATIGNHTFYKEKPNG